MAEKILVVEDESITRASIADFLRKEGYEVEEAGDGAQAIEHFGVQHFDLVVTDLVMPQLNGFKLIARVHSISPNTPVILITAYLSSNSGKAILSGTAEFIGKPVELDVLLATVRNLLLRPIPISIRVEKDRLGHLSSSPLRRGKDPVKR